MEWLKKAWKWIVGALTVVGAIALYVLMTKNDAQKKVENLENEIDEIEKGIQKKEEERKAAMEKADDSAERGAGIDKEIEKAKKKQTDLTDRRENMKKIFDKYGDK